MPAAATGRSQTSPTRSSMAGDCSPARPNQQPSRAGSPTGATGGGVISYPRVAPALVDATPLAPAPGQAFTPTSVRPGLGGADAATRDEASSATRGRNSACGRLPPAGALPRLRRP